MNNGIGKLRCQFNRTNYRTLLLYAVYSVLLNLLMEILARRSISDAFGFVLRSPHVFCYGVLLIFFTLCLALLFRRRTFFFVLISAIWFGVSFANFIILSYRSMPLTASDIWLMASVRDIFEKYLSHFMLALLMLGISAVLGFVFFLWQNTRKAEPAFWFGLTHTLLGGCLLLLATVLLLHTGALSKSTEYSKLSEAYQKNGFAYSFSASLVTRGVVSPEKYSEPIVQDILDRQKTLPTTSKTKPNIIYVQLESFFDANYMKELTFSENPVPNFSALRSTCTNGLLSVPGVGAGTANTEFEVLTGMNLDHFGVGEYPYMTTIMNKPLESLASVLSGIGYGTHAIHNNNATFYDRDIVYANLCFDTFTSIEYMNQVEYNPRGWAKDSVLTGEIVNALRSTEGRDFVFAVSVQPHGKYPSVLQEEVPIVEVGGMADEARQNGFAYYLGQLKECDAFIAELTAEMKRFDEPTVVVFYGDHLPSFNIQLEELSYGDNQTTEYILWSNFDMKREQRDLQTYQLSAYILDRCGIHEGTMFREHQLFSYAPETERVYTDELLVLEYDLVDGEHYASNPIPLPTDLQFGVLKITLSSVVPEDPETGSYMIYGENFTPYSTVLVNDEAYPTEFLSPQQLRLSEALLATEDVIAVAQISATDSLLVLSRTEPIKWEG